MVPERDPSRLDRWGFASGAGLAMAVAIGIPVRFAFPEQDALLSYGAVFVMGAALGALFYGRRQVGGT